MTTERFAAIANLLRPHKTIGYGKIRVGRKGDGGYVCIDDFHNVIIAHSLGVGGETSWDADIAKRGITVRMYDDTVGSIPVPNGAVFLRQRIVPTGAEIIGTTSLTRLANEFKSGTAILKMDIEHSEWDVLMRVADEDLAKWRQVIVEFHCFRLVIDDYWFQRAITALEKLHRLFAVVHLHANNYAPVCISGGAAFPDVLEVTYGNRARYEFEPSNERFPTKLDYPNNPHAPEIPIGRLAG